MCVIIYVPKESNIEESELRNAWNTNPDGAGYSIQKNGKVFFKRGFMKYEDYLNEINPLIGKYNLMLHFRISTSKAVNKLQTHPYKKGNVTLTEGVTEKPVICMNGIISGQQEYRNCNDTMSYIIDHKEAFSNINQDILNIIEDSTGAKWAVMTPEKVLLSSKFTKENGKYYSNKNHLRRVLYYYKKKNTLDNMIKNKNLKKSIRKDKELHFDLLDFIDTWCNSQYSGMCQMCTKCLKTAKTLRDVKITLNENFFMEGHGYELEDENDLEKENQCILFDEYDSIYDDWYGDIYNYKQDYLFDE